MAITTWGMLAKSQTDPEKIEEAIARLIVEHNEDEEAHLGPGQSLQSHKASEIIDHLINSIIADKINDLEIGIRKMRWDALQFEFPFDDIDGWTQDNFGSGAVDPWFGSVRFTTGDTINSRASMYAQAYSEKMGANYFKNPRVMFLVSVFGQTGQTCNFSVGSEPDMGFGFEIINNVLWAVKWKDSNKYAAQIATIPADWTTYRLKAIYTTGVKIDYYIDDVLKHTYTTNLPEESAEAEDELNWFSAKITNQAAADKIMYLRNLLFAQDY